MKLRISNGDMQLKLDSTEDLEFQDIFKAYNLVMKLNDSLSVDDGLDNSKSVDDVDSDEPAENNEPLIKPYSHSNRTYGDVKVGVECPKCGHIGVQPVKMGFRFVKCQNCLAKLFLSPANGTWGVKDDKGMTYRADSFYRDKFENDEQNEFQKMFSKSKDPKIPDIYSTIPEIEKYLDENGVNYDECRFKGQYLEKLKEVKTND